MTNQDSAVTAGLKSNRNNVGFHGDDADEPTVTETSTFSEITMTDDSDDDLMLHKKVAMPVFHWVM